MAPPDATVRTVATPAPSAGDLLAGRYRLRAVLPPAPGGPSVLWQAHDELLARPVALTVLPAGASAAAPALLDAAARTGPVLAPGLVRVDDADVGTAGVAAWVVSEWVDGPALPALLAGGPVPPARAVALLEQAADALAHLHGAGLCHGRVTPGNVLLGADGRVRLTGAVLSAVLRDESPGSEADDTRALADVLHALLTATWPGDADRSGGLPAPGPRTLSALPRPLRRVLEPATPPATPLALAATARAALTPGAVPRGRLRRAAPYLVWLALVAGAAGAGGWWLAQPPAVARPASAPATAPTSLDAPGPAPAEH